MDPKIQSRVDAAKVDLAHWSELLNSKWREFEQVAQSMSVGREVEVEAWGEENEEIGTSTQIHLGFKRIRGEWRVCLARENSDEPWGHPNTHPDVECASWKPIADCSRDDRVWATRYIDRLAEALAVVAEEITSEVEQAVAELAKSTTLLRQGGSKAKG